MSTIAEKSYLTPPEVADLLGIAAEKVVGCIRRGELLAFDVANPGSTRPRFRVSREALQQFLASRSTRRPEKPQRRRRKRPPQPRHFANV